MKYLILLIVFIQIDVLFCKVETKHKQEFKLFTDKNFNEVINSKEAWLIEIYSGWCGTCQEFEPTWNKVIKKLKGIKIGRINIDDKEGKHLANKIRALDDGLPTVRLYYNTDKYVNIMTGVEEIYNESQLENKINESMKKYLKRDKTIYYKTEL